MTLGTTGGRAFATDAGGSVWQNVTRRGRADAAVHPQARSPDPVVHSSHSPYIGVLAYGGRPDGFFGIHSIDARGPTANGDGARRWRLHAGGAADRHGDHRRALRAGHGRLPPRQGQRLGGVGHRRARRDQPGAVQLFPDLR